MARDAAKGLGRWSEGSERGKRARAASPGRASAAKWTGAAFLAGLLFAVVATSAWIVLNFVKQEKPEPTFMAFYIDEHQQRSGSEKADPRKTRLSSLIPAAPWIEADRKALLEAKIFNKPDSPEDKTRNPSKEVMETRLKSLHALKPDESLVVYVSSYAAVDSEGKIQILVYDSNAYRPDTLLPLKTILSRLKECPSRRKVLVLDIMRNTFDPFDIGGTADGVADLVRNELQSPSDSKTADDPNLLVIGACGRGETALGAESVGSTVFGHFFRRALSDPAADVNGNRAVSVKELAKYLERKVDQWAQHFRATRQRPFLAGSGKDFDLTALTSKRSPTTWSWPWKRSPSPPPPEASVEAEKAAEKTPEKTKTAESDPAKGKDDKAKEEGKTLDPETAGYPTWLAERWAFYEASLKSKDFLAAPRAFRRLGAVLLRAEQRWRGGGDARVARDDLEAEIRDLQASIVEAPKLPRPRDFRSVGQAVALGWKPDKEPGISLQKLLRLPFKQIDDKVKGEFLTQFKGKTSLDLAGAMIDALRSQPLAPPTLELLDSIVTASLLPRDLVELRFLRQLSQRAKEDAGEWSNTTARRAWEVVVTAEEANSETNAFPWLGARLAQADALRHAAEVSLLPAAAGHVSPAEVSQTWDQAFVAYEVIHRFQRSIQDADERRGRAMAMLRYSIPYLDAGGDAEFERAWFEAAQMLNTLDSLLQRPSQALSPEQLESLNLKLNETVSLLSRLVDSLERPFQTAEIDLLVDQCRSKLTRPDPLLARKIDVILATPFTTLNARKQLWAACRVLDERLAAIPMDNAQTGLGSGLEPANTMSPRERLSRRAKRLSWLVRLAGADDTAERLNGFLELIQEAGRLQKETGAKFPSSMSDSQSVWSNLAGYAFLVRLKFEEMVKVREPIDGRDRTGWVAPVFLLDPSWNPTRLARIRDANANWAWLAEHYVHQARDVHQQPDQGDIADFDQKAAQDCWTCDPAAPRSSELLPEIYLEFASPSPLKLTRDNPNAEFSLQVSLRAPQGEKRRKITLKILKPDDSRLKISSPSPNELDLEPDSPQPTNMTVAWDEGESSRPAQPIPKGFIVQARLPNQQTFHVMVPTEIVSENTRPRLVITADPAQPDDLPTGKLRLRPLPIRQPFYVFVNNPSSKVRDLVVEVSAEGGVNPAPAKIKVEPNATAQVVTFGAPTLKPVDPLPAITGPLKIILREDKPDGRGQVLETREIPVDIATAEDYLRDYVEVSQARFIPSRAGEKNRLIVKLKALPRLSGPPCKVELVLPRDPTLFPSLREDAEGTLSDELEPGKTLELFAEDLSLDPSAPETGSFYLNLDGLERAIWFRTKFVANGTPQQAVIEPAPRVRLKTEIKPEPPAAQLIVSTTVDNAPPGALLLLGLGRLEAGKFVEDRKTWVAPARDRGIGFDAKGEKGALLFEASVKDWVHNFNTANLRGERILFAWLRDPEGKTVLNQAAVPLLLDDKPPDKISLELPTKVAHGTKALNVKGTVAPPASGIKEVLFFVGNKADFEKSKTSGLAAAGKATDLSGKAWEALLPLPKDPSGSIVVSARFMSGVGLTQFAAPQEVAIIAPLPTQAEMEAENVKAKKPPALGSIEGKVLEGDRPQPGLTVYLLTDDPEAKEKERNKPLDMKKSAANGSFAFKDLKPGHYRVFCEKASAMRKDLKPVNVESGMAAEVTLSLVFN